MIFRVAALCVLVIAAPAAAQGFDLGVAGGVNFATLDETRQADLANSTGYHVGAYVDVSLPVAALRVGGYYLQAGDLETTSGAPVASAAFVTVPVDLLIQTPTPVVKAYVLVGPEVRFAVDTEGDVPQIDRASPNVAGNVGVGARFGSPLGGLSGFVEVRYARDLTAFAEDNVAGFETDNAYELSLFMLRAGIGL
ncbi:MAG: outer membrane beta-barrel protein [Bacteroidota bacterium]